MNTTKVIDIAEEKPEQMFDIGVKDWHNFVLSNGLLSLNCVHTIFRLSPIKAS